jgi:hypothetical protein
LAGIPGRSGYLLIVSQLPKSNVTAERGALLSSLDWETKE